MTSCLVPRYEAAHYVLKTLAYTMINLRHYGLHCSRARYMCLHSSADCAAIVLALCRSLGATTHIFASRVWLSPLIRSHKHSQPWCH